MKNKMKKMKNCCKIKKIRKTQKIKKTKTKFQQLNLEKNADHLQKSGLRYIKVNLSDQVLQEIGKIITPQ